MFDWLGIGSYAPGSAGEWDAWDSAAFDRISNEGISSQSDSLMGQDWDYWGDLFGGQGGGGGGVKMQQAQAPQLQNPMNVLSGLMGMAGNRQYQAGGSPYSNEYVTGLMRV